MPPYKRGTHPWATSACLSPAPPNRTETARFSDGRATTTLASWVTRKTFPVHFAPESNRLCPLVARVHTSYTNQLLRFGSGRRESNPRGPAWQAGAVPLGHGRMSFTCIWRDSNPQSASRSSSPFGGDAYACSATDRGWLLDEDELSPVRSAAAGTRVEQSGSSVRKRLLAELAMGIEPT